MTGFATLLSQCSDVVECGKGGQKTVYKAHHSTFGAVAIKRGKYNSDASLERITREVELLKSLDSDYFAKNFEFLVDPTEREFLILEEFLDAEPLPVAAPRFLAEVDSTADSSEPNCIPSLAFSRTTRGSSYLQKAV